MKNKLIFITTINILLSCSRDVTSLNAPYYIKIDVGTGISSKLANEDYGSSRLKKIVISSLAFGKEITENIAMDLGFYAVNRQHFKRAISLSGKSFTLIQASQNFRSKAVILNGTYTFLTSSLIRPYISVGGGYTRNRTSDYHTTSILSNNKEAHASFYGKSINRPVYRFATGIKHRLDPFELSLEYSHLNLGKFSTSDVVEVIGPEILPTVEKVASGGRTKIRYHTINIGLKLLF